MEARYAPIALFVYNRPWHVRQVVEALQKNEQAAESDVYIFSDAPKYPEAIFAVQEVRDYIRTVKGFKSVSIIERKENAGLANSIIEGVTKICNEYGRVIVLEDDLITAPYFLRFMNDALKMYEFDERVVGVHGYMFPVRAALPETFFLRGANSWGWATWSRAWKLFEPDGEKLLAGLRDRNLTRQFDMNGSCSYIQMLEHQIAGRNDSWAIRWRASVFLAIDGLTLFPGESLVQNIGFDSSGVHCDNSDVYAVKLAAEPVNVVRIPVEECGVALASLIAFYHAQRAGLLERAFRYLRRIMKSRGCANAV